MNRDLMCSVALKKLGKVVAVMVVLSSFVGLEARTADAEPQLVKPRMMVGVWESWHAWNPTTKKFIDNTTSWMPSLKFTVAGPVESGSQFSVDFTKPNGALWFHYDLNTEETPADEWATLETPRDDSTAAEKKYSTGIGTFGFKIRLKNELTGANKILYTGKFKVTRVSNSNGTPVTKNSFDYVVDHDWTLPLGSLYGLPSGGSPRLAATMWFKGGLPGSDIAGYIYYNGKPISSTKGQGTTGTTEQEWSTKTMDKGDPRWESRVMEWYNVAIAPNDPDSPNEGMFYLSKNPGTYEIKVLRKGKLCRQAKFTVANGDIVDNGIATNNKFNNGRYFLPVKVLGTSDGTYNKLAWKTGAYYGNPLKGFTAP